MMFRDGIPMEEIRVTKSIYPEAGRQYGKMPKATARAIERLGKSMLGEHEPGAEKEISWGDGTISFTGRDGALSGVLLRISQILQRNRARIVPRYYLIRDMCLIK